VGAWVFVDHFGPLTASQAMSVAAHPHTGLQTATWLFSGQVQHCDSLGNNQIIRPGQLNLMTAGRGISHSELQIEVDEELHAIQLWIALPNEERMQSPDFVHYDDLPTFSTEEISGTVFVGEFNNQKSPAKVHSPLVGVEISIDSKDSFFLELDPNFEYAIIPFAGDLQINGDSVNSGHLYFSEIGHTQIQVQSMSQAAKFILLGGAPFTEPLVMWWNFIGRSHEEILEMRSEWETRSALFGIVQDEIQSRIPAPELPAITLVPR
jgi:redox-sensitive bicupin YhaK (pirin superfamily)